MFGQTGMGLELPMIPAPSGGEGNSNVSPLPTGGAEAVAPAAMVTPLEDPTGGQGPNAPQRYATLEELKARKGYGQAYAGGPMPTVPAAAGTVATTAAPPGANVPVAPTDVPVSERGYAARAPLPRERPQGPQGAARSDAEWRGTPLTAVPGTSAREVPMRGTSLRSGAPTQVVPESGTSPAATLVPPRAAPGEAVPAAQPMPEPTTAAPTVPPETTRAYGPQRGRPAMGGPDQYEPIAGRQPGYIRAVPGQPTGEVPVGGAEAQPRAGRTDVYAPGYTSSIRETEDYIVRAAQRRGIDPQVALTVYDREGRTNYRSQSPGEESYGPFQLNRQGGIGAEFERDNPGVDIRDPRNWQRTVDYALDRAVERGWGPWRGAAKAGLGSRQGLPTPSQVVGRVMGYSSEFTGPPTGGSMRPRSQLAPTQVSAQARQSAVEFLRERGGGSRVEGLSGQFADRLARAAEAAEAATGEKLKITSLVRSHEEQAALHQRHLAGGPLAAPPGRSRHQTGEAADISRGKALDWLHANADRYGLEFLKGQAFRDDPVHIQLARDGGVRVFRPGVRAPVAEQPPRGEPLPPPAPASTPTPAAPAPTVAQPQQQQQQESPRRAPPQLEVGEAGREELSLARLSESERRARREKGRRNV